MQETFLTAALASKNTGLANSSSNIAPSSETSSSSSDIPTTSDKTTLDSEVGPLTDPEIRPLADPGNLAEQNLEEVSSIILITSLLLFQCQFASYLVTSLKIVYAP